MRSKRQVNTPPLTPKEHPVHEELTRYLEEGLSPAEAYGVVSVVRSMRRNKNLLLRTEDVEGPEMFSEYREEEGWTYHDLLREDHLTKEHEVGEIEVPQGKVQEGRSQRLTRAGCSDSPASHHDEGHADGTLRITERWRCVRWIHRISRWERCLPCYLQECGSERPDSDGLHLQVRNRCPSRELVQVTRSRP